MATTFYAWREVKDGKHPKEGESLWITLEKPDKTRLTVYGKYVDGRYKTQEAGKVIAWTYARPPKPYDLDSKGYDALYIAAETNRNIPCRVVKEFLVSGVKYCEIITSGEQERVPAQFITRLGD